MGKAIYNEHWKTKEKPYLTALKRQTIAIIL
jgi:hypothetical protein